MLKPSKEIKNQIWISHLNSIYNLIQEARNSNYLDEFLFLIANVSDNMMYYLVYGLTHLVLLDINLKDAAKVLIDTLTLGPRSQADSLNPCLDFK